MAGWALAAARHPWVCAACLALGGLVLCLLLAATGQQQQFTVSPQEVRADQGCSYLWTVTSQPRFQPWVGYASDGMDGFAASSLAVQEQGRPLGPAHAMHDQVRQHGGGAYSHWGGVLYFSASDCSDVRTNGRRYEVTLAASLATRGKVAAGGAVVAVAWGIAGLLWRWAGARPGVGVGLRKGFGWVRAAFAPNHGGLLSSMALLVALLLACLGLLYAGWTTDLAAGLALGWYFQISDAMAYWSCANALLDWGRFGEPSVLGEWCQRRSIYPSLLAGLAWLGQRDIVWALALQAVVLGAAFWCAVRRAIGWTGPVAGVLMALLLLVFSMHDAIGLTMTENAGLVFGCMGFACLAVSASRRSLPWALAGVAVLSIALNARAGAFFVLPLLVLGTGWCAHVLGRPVWRWTLAAAVAAATGFMLQSSLVLATGGDPANSHGNFSYVLYGLSVGGKGWQQVLLDHPDLPGSDAAMSRQIFALAWANIVSQPRLLLQGLWHNVALFLHSGTYGYQRLFDAAQPVQVLWWLGWIALWQGRRDPLQAFAGLASLGVTLSVPWLLMDGGARIFAATLPFEAFQTAMGLAWCAAWVLRLPSRAGAGALPHGVGPWLRGRPEAALLCLLALSMVLPHLLRSGAGVVADGAVEPCPAEQRTIVTTIGRHGGLLLDLSPGASGADVLRGRADRDRILASAPTAWWRPGFAAFTGRSILLAYQEWRSDPLAPGPYTVYSNESLTDWYGRRVRLCTSKDAFVRVFDNPQFLLMSIQALDRKPLP